jgi:hypothetical protein
LLPACCCFLGADGVCDASIDLPWLKPSF